MPAEPLPVVLLPGLEGTGRLFARFLAAATGALDLRVVRYPSDRVLRYAALMGLVRKQLPREERWALLAESFSGPLALRLAAEAPPGLGAVALAASFHRQPARRWLMVGASLVVGGGGPQWVPPRSRYSHPAPRAVTWRSCGTLDAPSARRARSIRPGSCRICGDSAPATNSRSCSILPAVATERRPTPNRAAPISIRWRKCCAGSGSCSRSLG